jgi:transposase
MAERRVFTNEFKANAIELAGRGDKTIEQVAKDLGINANRIYRWRKRAKDAEEQGTKAFPGHGNPRDEELFQLRKRVRELEDANEILKKAAVIFMERKPQ